MWGVCMERICGSRKEEENSVGQGEVEALLRCRGIALPLRKETGLKYDLEVECGKERCDGQGQRGQRWDMGGLGASPLMVTE